MARPRTPTASRAKRVSRRERLLEVAETMFTQTPYEEVSIDDISERAGTAHGLAFHYFGSKRGLYLAVMERMGERAETGFGANNEPDPVRWLEAELDTLLDQASHNAQIFVMTVRNSAGAEVSEILARRRTEAAERILERLAPARTPLLLRIAVVSWVAYANEVVAAWVEQASGSRSQIRSLLIGTLNDTLASVAALERRAGFDPATFAAA